MSIDTDAGQGESAELMRARREAELDQRAAEVGEGLPVKEMRYLAAKIMEDSEDLDHGE